ncbi:hypothetical protein K437DRAFT_107419 [Tilletiaria anomala UBC 951]|uniref:Uncharacterized protein n=1 Tax=Tilletiaria anomala (strain ATCC 24038 / CBS 436.72 / UBC 951) TaxID=1037660 RepID=A0A066VXM3_TILAU|nr:uncharacterized protein K437DRAFT_107419 [Tilletiaria anomala UBC 951]KDN46457.1 hypothetical protein K437DRAFT_107419 [Tilletiaria anomala UBC 951]
MARIGRRTGLRTRLDVGRLFAGQGWMVESKCEGGERVRPRGSGKVESGAQPERERLATPTFSNQNGCRLPGGSMILILSICLVVPL